MKLSKILLVIAALCGLSCVPTAEAQTTIYTGTVRDLSGALTGTVGAPVTSGNVTFTLTPSVDTTISGVSRFVPTVITCGLNASGQVVAGDLASPCTVTQNTALTPSGTSYTVCIQPYFTTPGSCFVDYATVSTKDISTAAPTPALNPLYPNLTAPGPIGVAQPNTVNATAVMSQSALTKSAPTACVESFLTSAMAGDYGQAVNAAVQAAPLLAVSRVSICVPGDHAVSTQIIFDRPIHFDMTGSRLIPQAALSHSNMALTGVTLTSGSQAMTVTNTSGLAAGYAIGGPGIPPQTQIFSVNSGTTLTLTQAAIASVSASTATAVNAQPVMKWIYNANAFQREFVNYGAAMKGVWIEDPGFRSLTGVQGIQIYGWDTIPMYDTRIYDLDGSGLVLGGWTPLSLGSAGATVRESNFYNTSIRYCGDLATGQASLADQTPYQGGGLADENNQLGFHGGQIVGSYATSLYIGTNNTSHFNSVAGPRLTWFDNNFQIEDFLYRWNTTGGYTANGPVVGALADSVYIPVGGDIHFTDGEIAITGLGKSLFHVGSLGQLDVRGNLISAFGTGFGATFVVSVTNGTPNATLVSGTTGFPIDGSWNGLGVQINGANYTIKTATATVLTLTVNYAGSTSGSASLSTGDGGKYLTVDTVLYTTKFAGNTYADPDPKALSWMGITLAQAWPAFAFGTMFAQWDVEYNGTRWIGEKLILSAPINGTYATFNTVNGNVAQGTAAVDYCPACGTYGAGRLMALGNTVGGYGEIDFLLFKGDGSGAVTPVSVTSTGLNINGSPISASHLANGTTGSGSVVLASSPTISGSPTISTPGSASYLPGENELAPSLTTGQVYQHCFGVAMSTNNCMMQQFNYVGGSGSASNSITWGLYGNVNPLIFDGNGKLSSFQYQSLATTGTAPFLVSSTTPVANLSIGGNAVNLSGTPTLPNGTAATTQAQGDNSTKLATTAYADAHLPRVVASIADTAYSSTATIGGGGNTIYTTPNDATTHTFRVCGTQAVTIAGTAGTFQMYFYGILAASNRNFGGSAAMSVTATTGAQSGCVVMNVDPNAAIAFTDSASGVTGTPTIHYSWFIEMVR
jgi:hypothetical protein